MLAASTAFVYDTFPYQEFCHNPIQTISTTCSKWFTPIL